MTIPSPSPRLREAIQELYRVFKPYKFLRHPEGCPCCVSDSDKHLLFSKPLSELSQDDLGRFAWKALTTWGTVEDLKHFLPRLLELVAKDECAPFDREVLFGKLRLGGWIAWPTHETNSVENYLNACWMDCLDSEAGAVWLDELLCGLGNAMDDLSPFLNAWATCRLGTGYTHMVAFIDWNAVSLLKHKRLKNSFWSNAREQMTQVVDWLANPETVRSLEQLFAEDPNSKFSDALASAIDRLTDVQQLLKAN